MKTEDKPLAQLVVDTVSKTLGLTSNGISRFPSGVLLKSNMPATISEGFFLTNTTEYELIKTGRLVEETDALFAAINKYFE
jgi:N-acetylmuramoyl-L-alanine amidase